MCEGLLRKGQKVHINIPWNFPLPYQPFFTISTIFIFKRGNSRVYITTLVEICNLRFLPSLSDLRKQKPRFSLALNPTHSRSQ
ncbi:hypothetical protein RIF29_41373 [Crotalaria pallida]|uniref:Uncharacterized protein n=1 Tax=Crotalaria pallida TaxID=3830 RepID=A0AAN9E5A2_CROPI